MNTMERSIWLVDDNEADNFLHRLVLERAGWAGEVRVFERPEHALESALDEAHPLPEVVLLDVNMPGMTGWEWLARAARAAPGILSRTRIHVLTTSVDPSDAERARSVPGLAGFIEKPLTVEDVAAL